MVALIWSPTQRTALFDRHCPPRSSDTLGPDDLGEVLWKRRFANQIGYAVQLGYHRHPGRAIESGEVAASTERYDAIVAAMLERLRGASVVLPVPAFLERIALVARAEARRQALARLCRDPMPDQLERLDALLWIVRKT